jgi:pimeloyl-ACP methyl ester carboxylesterase
MLLVALARPQRIAGLLGLAAAPDFTEELIWSQLDAATRKRLQQDGVIFQSSDYDDEPHPITLDLIEEARAHLLLNRPIPYQGPVRLLHGLKDTDVPWQVSLRLADQLTSRDVRLTLVKDGDHRLSEPAHLQLLSRSLTELLDELH